NAVAASYGGLQRTFTVTAGVFLLGLVGLGLVARHLGRTTQRLEAAEARTRAIVDTAAEGILTGNEDGAVAAFNAAAARLFGYAPEETLGAAVAVLWPDGAARLAGLLSPDRPAGGPRTFHGELEGRRKDGSRVPLDLAVSATRVGGRFLLTAIARDLTERRRT